MKSKSIILLVTGFLALSASPLKAAAPTQEERISAIVLEVIEPQAEAEVIETPKTVQEVLLAVCEDRGYGEACAKHLLGMLWKESNNISTAIGDRGKARGYFQIWYKLHNISIDCTEDLECSANWTLDYMERNHYPKYVSYAVQCHNGCNIANGYAASALRHGVRLWNQPLEVTTAEERRLAMN